MCMRGQKSREAPFCLLLIILFRDIRDDLFSRLENSNSMEFQKKMIGSKFGLV